MTDDTDRPPWWEWWAILALATVMNPLTWVIVGTIVIIGVTS